MNDLYMNVCSQILIQLQRKEYLEYENPTDVDRHDDDLKVVMERITVLREFRNRLESLI